MDGRLFSGDLLPVNTTGHIYRNGFGRVIAIVIHIQVFQYTVLRGLIKIQL